MTRKRVTASEKKQRHEWAVRQIDAGMGLSELTALTAETWGCSRRNAVLDYAIRRLDQKDFRFRLQAALAEAGLDKDSLESLKRSLRRWELL